MEAKAIPVGRIFSDSDIMYRIPIYQRHYVWNKEKQFDQIWDDLQSKIRARIENPMTITPHYMGSIVIESAAPSTSFAIPQWNVIDGQQRLTTLQIILTSLRDVAKSIQHRFPESHMESILEDIPRHQSNKNEHLMQDKDTDWMKVTPTKFDRKVYTDVISLGSKEKIREKYQKHFTQRGHLHRTNPRLSKIPTILSAYIYFYDTFLDFILSNEEGEENNPTDIFKSASTLYAAILDDLMLVKIELGAKDDPQVIFETLNAGGTPLLASDLIRNHIFMKAQNLHPGNNIHHLYSKYWNTFENEFWTTEEKQGRIQRARLEFFASHYISATNGREVNVSQVFQEYKKASSEITDIVEELQTFSNYGASYRGIIEGSGSKLLSEVGQKLKLFDITTAYPLILRVDQSTLQESEKKLIFQDVVSFIVRRAVCNLSSKGYNKFFLQIIRSLKGSSVSHQSIRDFLLRQTSNTTRWPNNEEFEKSLLESSLYNIMSSKSLVYFLLEIDMNLRTSLRESIHISPQGLTLEHVLPQNWCAHWPLPDGTSVDIEEREKASWVQDTDRLKAISTRDSLLHTLGNLTLLTHPLNSTVRNSSFTIKKSHIISNSSLTLNSYFQNVSQWDESAIQDRSRSLSSVAKSIWSHPGK